MQNAVECVLVLFAGEPIAEYAFGLVEQCLSSFRFATAVVFGRCMYGMEKVHGNTEKNQWKYGENEVFQCGRDRQICGSYRTISEYLHCVAPENCVHSSYT